MLVLILGNKTFTNIISVLQNKFVFL